MSILASKCCIGLMFAIIPSFFWMSARATNHDEFYSSVAGLETLLDTEFELVRELRHYMRFLTEQLQLLESEVTKIEQEHTLASIDREYYLTNPVNAFRLIKRLHIDWEAFEQRIQVDNVVDKFSKRMAMLRKRLHFPIQADMEGSALALARLQDTYRLDIGQVAAGILNGVKYGNDMSWQDCFILAQQLYNVKDYNHTKMWYKESIERLHKQLYHSEPESLEVMELIAEKLYYLGDYESALNISQQVLQLDSRRSKAWEIKIASLETDSYTPNSEIPESDSSPYHTSEEFQTYTKLCRDELKPTPRQQRHLRCRYTHNNLPHRILFPFKVEEHSLDPLVLTFHELFASDTKIKELQVLAAPHMTRSTVRTDTPHLSIASEYRISKNAWLPYDRHVYMQDMLHELHDATGLDMTHCEELQVANYGLGGHYEPHWDFFTNESEYPDDAGNRIATAIFYFSDVEQGGATAFPFLRFAVRPKKGNVLFWYNLHHSLDMDYRTKHAGCPVLKGSKWIANIWIHEMTQTFHRPCRLQQDNEISLKYQIIK